MARRLLIICVFVTLALPAAAQIIVEPPGGPPPAWLIGPRPRYADPRLYVYPQARPLDERCRALKEQLEAELLQPAPLRRLFQARVAHNAGTRFCREGQPERGIAEYQKGLFALRQWRRY